MAAASDGRAQLGQQVSGCAEPGSWNTRATTRSRRARSSSPTALTSAPRPRSQLVCTTRPAPPTTSARLRTTSPAPSTPVGAPTSPPRALATANSLQGPSLRKMQRSGPNWHVPLTRSAARPQARQLRGGIQEHQVERRPPSYGPIQRRIHQSASSVHSRSSTKRGRFNEDYSQHLMAPPRLVASSSVQNPLKLARSLFIKLCNLGFRTLVRASSFWLSILVIVKSSYTRLPATRIHSGVDLRSHR